MLGRVGGARPGTASRPPRDRSRRRGPPARSSAMSQSTQRAQQRRARPARRRAPGRLTTRSSALARAMPSRSLAATFAVDAVSQLGDSEDVAARDEPARHGVGDLHRRVGALDGLEEGGLGVADPAHGGLQLAQQDARVDLGRLALEGGVERGLALVELAERPGERGVLQPAAQRSRARRARGRAASPAPPAARARRSGRPRARGGCARWPRRPRRRARRSRRCAAPRAPPRDRDSPRRGGPAPGSRRPWAPSPASARPARRRHRDAPGARRARPGRRAPRRRPRRTAARCSSAAASSQRSSSS